MTSIRKRIRRIGAVVAGAALIASLGAGCAAAGGSAGGSTLVAYTGQSGDYQLNFNPFSPSSIGGVGTIYEPLFYQNKATVSDPVPLLGTEQSWNADGTVLTIGLRSGVTWSDGAPFTADDVVFTFDMLKKTPAINSGGFDGTAAKVDDTHVTITFAAPSFVKGPDVLSTVIVPAHLWQSIDPTQDVVAQPVGTGAYTLGEFKPQGYTFVANPTYWGGAPAVKSIRYVALSGNQAGVDGVTAQTIDWYTGAIPDVQNASQKYPGYTAFTQWQNQMVLATCSSVALGCSGPQTDPAVRHALYYAIDREQLNRLAFQDTAGDISPTFALTPSQDSFASAKVEEKVAPGQAEPAKAASALEAAGWAKGADGIYAKDGQRLSLTVEVVTGWTDYITAIDTMASQAKAAGIELVAAQSSWNEWTEKKGSGDFQLAIDALWQGPAPDPYYVYRYFYDSKTGAPVGQKAGNNFARYSNPEVDAAIAALAALPLDDAAARQPHFDVIQAAIAQDMPYIPVLTGGTTSIWNTREFTGWPTQDDLYAFPAVWSQLDAAQVLKQITPQG